MTLTLELTASSAAKPSDVLQRSFDEQGGTIGRATNNSWILAHNKVSGQHAVISFRNGVFYIEDTSRNGVAVNSLENRLVRNRPYALKTGDRIFIEPYEIGVWIEGDAAAVPVSRVDPFADSDPFASPRSDWPVASVSPEMPAPGDIVDPLLLIPGAPARRTSPPPPVPSDDFLAQHYQPPSVAPTGPPEAPPAAAAIPAGYNPLDDAFSEPLQPPAARRSDPSSRAPAAPPATPPTPSPPARPAPPAAAVRPVSRPVTAPPAPPPARTTVPMPEPPPVLASDPFADLSTPASASGPIAVAPLDLDALTGPPPAVAPPAAAAPAPTVDPPAAVAAPAVRPRPGVDAPARRRQKEAPSDDTPTVKFPAPPAVSLPSESAAAAPSSVSPASPEPAIGPAEGIQAAPPALPASPPPPPSPLVAAPPVAAAPPAPNDPFPIPDAGRASAPPVDDLVAIAPPASPLPAGAAIPADLGALLTGAGLPAGLVTPELTRDIGRILRVVVEGLMDVLQSRQRIKEEFGMQQTIFRPSENNPLKFSANLDDALHNLFVKQNAAYLGSVAAFADAFDDLRDHQLAVLAGLRVAFNAMLAEFDPDHLQERFDAQIGKSALPLMPAKMRYWDLFRVMRADLAKDPEAAFERLFGEEFRSAYEEQFRDLKAQRRARASRSTSDPPLPR